MEKKIIRQTNSRVDPGFDIFDGIDCLLRLGEALVVVTLVVFVAVDNFVVTEFLTLASSLILSADSSENLLFTWCKVALREEQRDSNSLPDMLGFKALLLPNESLFSDSRNRDFLT